MENTISLVAGLDIGNGYVKGIYAADGAARTLIDIPSCTAGLSTKPNVPQEPNDALFEAMHDNMVCKINSPLVQDTRYLLYGERAIASGRELMEFDINAVNLSKAQQELSPMLILGCLAGAGVQAYWAEHHAVPFEVVHVDAYVGLALPIDEYPHHKDAFASALKATTHDVHICNFEGHEVIVRLAFRTVTVLPEGVSAQFAINAKGESFMDALLADVRQETPEEVDGITAKDVVQCTNTCGIDIGEGTVNLPVISNGKFNVEASATIPRGYGTVLEQSLEAVKQANIAAHSSRKALAELLLQEENAFNKRKIQTAKDIVCAESLDLVKLICRELSRVLRAGTTQVIYVYGGGATPMKPSLYKELIRVVDEFRGGDPMPVLYLDSAYSRNLNREGLYEVAKADFEVSEQ